MNCNEIQKRLLRGQTDDAEVRRHVAACPDCRSFAAVVEAVEQCTSGTEEPDALLDQAVLRAARERRQTIAPRRTMVYRVFGPALASAAALALAGLVWLFAIHSGNRPGVVVADREPAAVQESIPWGEDIDAELIAIDAELTGVAADVSSYAAGEAPQSGASPSGIDDALMLLDAEIYILEDQLEEKDEPEGGPPQANDSGGSARWMS